MTTELLGRWVRAQDEKHMALPLSPALQAAQCALALGSHGSGCTGSFNSCVLDSGTPAPHPSIFQPQPNLPQEFPAVLSPRSPQLPRSSASTSSPRLVLTIGHCARRAWTPASCTEDQAGPHRHPSSGRLAPFTCRTAGHHWSPGEWALGHPPTTVVPPTVPTDRAGAP